MSVSDAGIRDLCFISVVFGSGKSGFFAISEYSWNIYNGVNGALRFMILITKGTPNIVWVTLKVGSLKADEYTEWDLMLETCVYA